MSFLCNLSVIQRNALVQRSCRTALNSSLVVHRKSSVDFFSQQRQYGSESRRKRSFTKLFFKSFFVTSLVGGIGLTGLYYTDENSRLILDEYIPIVKQNVEDLQAQLITLYKTYFPEKVNSSQTESLVPGPLIKKQKPIETSYVETPETLSDSKSKPSSESGPFTAETTEVKKDPAMASLVEIDKMVKERNEKNYFTTKVRVEDIRSAIRDSTHSVGVAIDCLNQLNEATADYISCLKSAVSQKSADSKQQKSERDKVWSSVWKADDIKKSVQQKTEGNVFDATQKLALLRSAIDSACQDDSIRKDAILSEAIDKYGELQYSLSSSVHMVRLTQGELSLLTKYRDLSEEKSSRLHDDLKDILPGVPGKGTKSLSVEELNNLIKVAHERIARLQSRLSAVGDREKARLSSMMETQRSIIEDLVSNAVSMEIAREHARFELERHNWELEARQATEAELRQALARHSDHLTQMLRLKTEEMEHQFAFRLREALANEKQAFEAALRGWTRRMQAIEQVVDGRADLDRVSKETQALWLACETLSTALRQNVNQLFGDNSKQIDPTKGNTGPLKTVLGCIKDVAQGSDGRHDFVLTLLEKLPSSMENQGVYTEAALRARFDKVYKVCRNVALIDETGSDLVNYALSWLQSKLMYAVKATGTTLKSSGQKGSSYILTGSSIIDADDAEGPDSLQLLDSALAALSASHSLDETKKTRGQQGKSAAMSECSSISTANLELAVRLISQLKGQARAVAEDWLYDARTYLEAKRIADALTAYSAARGLSSFEERL